MLINDFVVSFQLLIIYAFLLLSLFLIFFKHYEYDNWVNEKKTKSENVSLVRHYISQIPLHRN
jgi:hypothetical protein